MLSECSSKNSFLHLYCNSNKKGSVSGNDIKITAMAFNNFSDRRKSDSMIGRCALSGEECCSILQGQTVISIFNLQKVHIASGFSCKQNAARPLPLTAAGFNGVVQQVSKYRTEIHIAERQLIREKESYLKFDSLCLCCTEVVFDQCIDSRIFTEWDRCMNGTRNSILHGFLPGTGMSRFPPVRVPGPCGLWRAGGA